jgi:L-alanine-DL-glutamate epimerase-like enolase superfamily enzyme
MTTTYERLSDLPLQIDGYTVDGLTRRVSTGFRRFTTVFRLTGAGLEGLGEDVTYEALEHRRLQRAGPQLPVTGRWTLDSFSRHLNRLDTFPEGRPASEVSRAYRRWALESAALDLALRQAGRPLHELLGRTPSPVRFVVSLNLGPAPSCDALRGRRTACREMHLKLDATPEWTDELLECLAASDTVETVDFKGAYHGTLTATETDAGLYRRVAHALPAAWVEDPDLTQPDARTALDPHRHRITWDAPIHSAADLAAQPWPGQAINIKPSRFGALKALFDTYDHCAAHGILVYGGGQFELGPGRGQAQYLAALFHADAPNDIAPACFDEVAPPTDAPCTPMTIVPAPSGFRATVDASRRTASVPADTAASAPTVAS